MCDLDFVMGRHWIQWDDYHIGFDMANRFCQHGLSTGANNGTSWEDAYQSIYTAASALATDDTLYVKDHSGIDISSGSVNITKSVHICGGCNLALTGTMTEPRDGITVLDGNLADVRGISFQPTSNSSPLSWSRVRVIRTRFTGTYGGGGFYISWSGGAILHMDRCSTIDCHALSGGGIYAYGENKLFLTNFLAQDCVATNNGGAIANRQSLPWLVTGANPTYSTYAPCYFIDNQAGNDGGAIYTSEYNVGYIRLLNSFFTGNIAGNYGGAIRAYTITDGSGIYNCLVAGNSAANYGGIWYQDYIYVGDARVAFCTIQNNVATTGNVGGIGRNGGSIAVDSCIIRGNLGASSHIQCNGFDVGKITNCDIWNKDSGGVVPSSSLGAGNIDVPPEFKGSGDHPWDLTPSTPDSVAKGGNPSIPGYLNIDALIRPRGALPSMGAYERILPYVNTSFAHFAMQGQM